MPAPVLSLQTLQYIGEAYANYNLSFAQMERAVRRFTSQSLV